MEAMMCACFWWPDQSDLVENVFAKQSVVMQGTLRVIGQQWAVFEDKQRERQQRERQQREAESHFR
jgi:hypothetical protein